MTGRRASTRLARHVRWHVALATLAAVFVGPALAGSSPTSAGLATAGKPPAVQRSNVTVDRVLERKLEQSKRGMANAIVTTWSYRQLALVRKLGVRGTQLKVLPMLLAPRLSESQLAKLRRAPFVRSIWANRKHRIQMEDTTWITKARYVWEGRTSPAIFTTNPDTAYTGKGVEIAVIDTGIDGRHEDTDNLKEYCETTGAVNGTASEVLCSPFPTPAPEVPTPPAPPGMTVPTSCSSGPVGLTNNARLDSTDDPPGGGHGSHVSGTIAGTGDASGGLAARHSTIGMAPEAKLRVYSANLAIALANFQILAAYDDMTCKKLRRQNNVVATSNSFGGGPGSSYNPNDPREVAVKRAYDAGILSVYAAGNDGPEHNTLSSNCISPWVVCVAASTKPDGIVGFSSVGRPSEPTDTNRNGRIGQPGAPTTIPDGPDAGTDPDPNPAFDAGDMAPDNHDRLLAQKLGLGLYRPTLAAPGVNVNSIDAQLGESPPDCLENDPALGLTLPSPPQPGPCYVQFNGTSMATPHVSGAVALITQAYRKGHGGSNPPSGVLIDILERSANVTKLPGYETEHQGAGRLDVLQAVRYARTHPNGLPKPNFGTPTPPFNAGQSPFNTAAVTCPTPAPPVFTPATPLALTACRYGATHASSYSPQSLNPVDFQTDQPPLASVIAPRYGQHFIDVPTKVERLRITVDWSTQPGNNLYIRLWRPGVNPDNEVQPAGPNRAFPDAENVGLAQVVTQRFLEVKAPEEANASENAPGLNPMLPPGRWILRVYHRAGPAAFLCVGRDENPRQNVGSDCVNYAVKIEMPTVQRVPTVAIGFPPSNTHINPAQRFIAVTGSATYPTPWEGITNWEVPGSVTSTPGGPAGEPSPDNRTVLYFHGNKHDAGEPGENQAQCTGKGRLDVPLVGCGPYLLPNATLSTNPLGPGQWLPPVSPLLDGTADRNIYDPNWTWCLATGPGCPGTVVSRPGPKTVEGPMTVEWWGGTIPAGETPGLFTMGWTIRLWADGRLAFVSDRIDRTPGVAGIPDRFKAVVSLPRIRAEQRFVLHVDTNVIDVDEEDVDVFYDHQAPGVNLCVADEAGETNFKCDSLVKMPVVAEGGPGGTPGFGSPRNVRVTDCVTTGPLCAPGDLRVAWDAVPGATTYRILRGTAPDSASLNATATPYATVAGTGCNSPNVPTWPTASRPGTSGVPQGLCFQDTTPALLTTYYYRVIAVSQAGTRSDVSLLVYGTPTQYDRRVKLKVDRLYAPQAWEYARLLNADGTSWEFPWDMIELSASPLGVLHRVFARSFTQGIGSAKNGRPYLLDNDAPRLDPVVTLTKTGPPTAKRAATVNYVMSYRNLGPATSSNAKIVDTLPPQVSFVSASTGGVYSSSTRKVTWTLGNVPANTSGSVTLSVRVSSTAPNGTLIVNRADFFGDNTLSPPTAAWTTTVVP